MNLLDATNVSGNEFILQISNNFNLEILLARQNLHENYTYAMVYS